MQARAICPCGVLTTVQSAFAPEPASAVTSTTGWSFAQPADKSPNPIRHARALMAPLAFDLGSSTQDARGVQLAEVLRRGFGLAVPPWLSRYASRARVASRLAAASDSDAGRCSTAPCASAS